MEGSFPRTRSGRDGPLSLLVVDDNPGDRDLIEAYLDESPRSYNVASADSLAEALDMVEKETFDLILLDLGLPDSQGIDTFRRMRAGSGDMPVVVVTGLDDDDLGAEAVRGGAQDYLTKNRVDPNTLVRSIRFSIERSESRARIDHLSGMLRAIRNVNQLIVREKDPDDLARKACEILLDVRGYTGVWIVRETGDGLNPAFAGAGWNGSFEGFCNKIGEGWLPDCAKTAAETDEGVASFFPKQNCPECPLHENHSFSGTACAELRHGGRSYGFMGVAVAEDLCIDDEEMALLIEISEDLAFAMRDIEVDTMRRESDERFRVITESSPDAIFIFDPKGEYAYANPAATRLLGYSPDELLGVNIVEVSVPDQIDKNLGHFREIIEKGRLIVEIELMRKDGVVVPVELSAVALPNGSLFWSCRDLTERHLAEERLRSSRQMLALVTETIQDVFWMSSPGVSEMLFVSRAYETLWERSRESLYNSPASFMEAIHPDDVEDYKAIVESYHANYEKYQCQYRIVRSDGETRWIEERGFPALSASGDVRFMAGVCSDITDRKRNEQELRFQALILSQIEDLVTVTDLDGNLTYVNEAACRTLGKSGEEMLGQKLHLFGGGPESAAIQDEILKKTLEDGLWQGEVAHRGKNGKTTILESRTHVVKDASGETIGVSGISTDITERKLTEKKLIESESRYRSIIDNLRDVLFTIDLTGKITFASPSTGDILGYDCDEVTRMNILDFLPEEDRRRAVETIPKGMAGEKIKAYITPALKKSGERVLLELDFSRIYRDGEVIGAQAIAKDVTERKEAEEELRRREEEYRNLVHNIPGMIYKGGADWGIEIIHKPDKVCGYSVEDFETGKIHWADIIHPDDKESVFTDGDRLAEEPMQLVQEYRIIAKDRGLKWVRDHKSSNFFDDGAFAGVNGVVFDITEMKHLQEQLNQSMKMEAIGRLAGGVAHDFNNALTPIMTISGALQSDLNPEHPVYEDIVEIKESAERCVGLTRQLLAFGRRQPLDMRVLNLNDVVANMEKMLSRVIGEDIILVKELAPELRNVEADIGQMEQILANLAVNARDAMPGGGKLTIKTQNVYLDGKFMEKFPNAAAGPYAMLVISDSGFGMEPETAERIFEPFFTTKEKGKGTGLGLSTVYGIVRQSGGSIRVFSNPGKGTSFVIYLPVVEKEAEAAEKTQEEPSECFGGSETILLVEDEASVRKVIKRMLKRSGYKVLEADKGSDAIRICQTIPEPIHLLVTDVIMPGMSGKELADHLTSVYPDMKVIFCSGYTDNAIVHHGVLDQGTNFLQKPFTNKSLIQKVRSVLNSED